MGLCDGPGSLVIFLSFLTPSCFFFFFKSTTPQEFMNSENPVSDSASRELLGQQAHKRSEAS